MTIACVLIPHLRARLELTRRPELAERPGLIVDRSGRRALVVDAFPAAGEARTGMTLEQALSLQPDAVALEADEPHYQRKFERTLRALERISDRVEGAELGVAYVGLDDLAQMHGGEAALLDALLQAVPSHFQPRIGVGPNQFIACVAARARRSSGVTTVARDPTTFLAPHSIDLLPCPSDLLEDLRRLGLGTLGAVAAQEPQALLDRFGHEGRRAWELSRGIDERPLRPRRPEEPVRETLSLPPESTSLALLRAALETLLERAYAQPRMRGRSAGAARLSCALEDGPSWERAFPFQSGVGEWRRAAQIVNARLETEHPQAPVEAITLTLTRLNGASGEQLTLFPDFRHDRERRLLEAERQLQARLGGARSLQRLVEVAPWHPAPELRTLQVSIDPAADDDLRPLSAPTPVAVREGAGEEPLAVRVGRRWREVAQIEEQWSFELWWRPTPLARHYYRISQADGRQLTLFRDQREACWYRQRGAA